MVSPLGVGDRAAGEENAAQECAGALFAGYICAVYTQIRLVERVAEFVKDLFLIRVGAYIGGQLLCAARACYRLNAAVITDV